MALKITLAKPKSQPAIDRIEITEVQIRRWGAAPSIEFSWSEGYTDDGKFVPKDTHREQIHDASAIIGATTDGKLTIEESIIQALLKWLIDGEKVAGAIA
jgi:hypothetical protein